MGIISGAKSQMQKSLGLSCSKLEWVVSLLPVGGFIASITGGKIIYNSIYTNLNEINCLNQNLIWYNNMVY